MECLKSIRKSHSLKQTQMAAQLNVSYSHYVKLENGYVKPSFELLKRIKEEFSEVDMNDFFE
ncbi:helix-turn-helix transcriptional regulator [Listeria monocytogenes]|uniref:helix-turn-helix domain-containing protein n=1 Tax=Listeria monocytogenes TaxID=1639 RepID=UPI000F1D3380|nr:helix-turn-helix transcriptional regulator [Listeria monocytogenes]EAC8001196.1 XRE family transcriptional regulator [Listeria monocytogenes]EJT8453025.1 helix-turn-helix transcriptional regulator [Listeria monocytogenes]EKZ7015218.1 helix-turn-helix transcriptional regulator [Listeria monocytogenes]MCM64477.1 XRE family transcriptional regulator [Listeria monocytogenes]TYU82201.1 helix-turn-helix transcriptional regulator [Listeria monocytogenes]